MKWIVHIREIAVAYKPGFLVIGRYDQSPELNLTTLGFPTRQPTY